jgi:hypothetical protein
MEYSAKVKMSLLFGMQIKHILLIAHLMGIWESLVEKAKQIRYGILLSEVRPM